MKELVFFESIGIKIDAFTTSRTIAEGTNIEPRKVKDAIRKHQKAFESFGVLASYQAETKNNKAGGRKAVGSHSARMKKAALPDGPKP